MRPGGSGAAETFEPRQIREEAAVRGSLWAPPGCLPGCVEIIKKGCPHQDGPYLLFGGGLLVQLQFWGEVEVFVAVEIDIEINCAPYIYIFPYQLRAKCWVGISGRITGCFYGRIRSIYRTMKLRIGITL
jgi:hypothetical protein